MKPRADCRSCSCSSVKGGVGVDIDGLDRQSAARSAAPSASRRTTALPVSPRLQPVGAADHLEHDLVGTGADPVQARVAPRALDAVLLHVARASVYLKALIGHFAGDARGV